MKSSKRRARRPGSVRRPSKIARGRRRRRHRTSACAPQSGRVSRESHGARCRVEGPAKIAQGIVLLQRCRAVCRRRIPRRLTPRRQLGRLYDWAPDVATQPDRVWFGYYKKRSGRPPCRFCKRNRRPVGWILANRRPARPVSPSGNWNITRMVQIIELPIADGWVYPCSANDLGAALAAVSPADLEGLSAIVLAPATRRDCSAYARYSGGERPAIFNFSLRQTLGFKLSAHVSMSCARRCCWVDLEYGMDLIMRGARIYSRWTAIEDLRNFILDHVLLHEIGHHVFWRERARRGFANPVSVRVSEQFAEDYALRMSRLNHRSNLFDENPMFRRPVTTSRDSPPRIWTANRRSRRKACGHRFIGRAGSSRAG